MTNATPFRIESSQAMTLFLIGLRIRRWHRPDAWLPAVAAMPPMLAELYDNPHSGFLGHRMTLAGGGPLVVQYWRSADDLVRYARDNQGLHRTAWKAFHARASREPGCVGLWHEIYELAPGAARGTYVGMSPAGLHQAVTAASPTGGVDPRLDPPYARVPRRLVPGGADHQTTRSPK